jgi:hypothetical protein
MSSVECPGVGLDPRLPPSSKLLVRRNIEKH